MSAIHDVRESKDGAIYRGTGFLMQEIQIAERQLVDQRAALEHAIVNLAAAFAARNMVEIKLTSERAVAAAAQVERTSAQIRNLSASLRDTFTTHINRRPHV